VTRHQPTRQGTAPGGAVKAHDSPGDALSLRSPSIKETQPTGKGLSLGSRYSSPQWLVRRILIVADRNKLHLERLLLRDTAFVSRIGKRRSGLTAFKWAYHLKAIVQMPYHYAPRRHDRSPSN